MDPNPEDLQKELQRFRRENEELRTTDPSCVEKNLRSWASPRIIVRGRDYYREDSVLSMEADQNGYIAASVEGTLDAPCQVHMQFDRFGMPVSKYTCPFTFEPLCKHAVAVLIAWQQQETDSEPTVGPLTAEDAAFAGGADDVLDQLSDVSWIPAASSCLAAMALTESTLYGRGRWVRLQLMPRSSVLTQEVAMRSMSSR